MGERAGLHCKRHGKWCPSGACDDCAAMAADASKTTADNVGLGAAMCTQGPHVHPVIEDAPYDWSRRTAYAVGVDPGRDEGSVARLANVDEPPTYPIYDQMLAYLRAVERGRLRAIEPRRCSPGEIHQSIPASVLALRNTDDVVGHFVNRLIAQDRLWTAESAAELVVAMAKREESRVKTLARIVGLLDPSPPQLVIIQK